MLNKIREVNSALQDNRRLMEIIQRLNSEKKTLENELDQIRKHEPELVNDKKLASWVGI